MKSLIVTVAGMSTRFNRDLDSPILKCLYYRHSYKYSLLYQIIEKAHAVDEIIIVGGYLYDQLEKFVKTYFSELISKIRLVYNSHYKDFGSGYSLLKGIQNISGLSDEVIFVEGDLYFDSGSFNEIVNSSKNIITINREPIYANKAVALYLSESDSPHYIYDTSHKTLNIDEPFTAIFNSGQIWKFMSVSRLKNICETLPHNKLEGTNLEIIQSYYDGMTGRDFDIVSVNTWVNCNTIEDYNTIEEFI